ncbi:MAG: M42 family metallopeptidase [Acutalibacter sp.]|nr:M42 family metallopeptidase [Acutalibacter sp.]
MNTEYTMEQVKRLCAIDSPSGFTERAADYLREELARLGYAPEKTRKGGVTVCLGGGAPERLDGLLLMAHVDTLGAVIQEVKGNGRLRLSPVGGLRAENCEAENCRIYTREGKVYTGCLQLCNASVHVNRDYGAAKRKFDTVEVLIDEPVKSADETRALGIEVGDFVCFDPRTVITESGYIKSRFLDDKLSAAILLGYAKELKEKKADPKRKVYLHFTVYEEVGHGAAAYVPEDVSEIVSVDMGCVGDGLKCTEREVSICAKDSGGPYDYTVTTALVNAAKEAEAAYAVDVYPFYGSDAEAALSAGYDVRHGLIGPGVYASHGYERSHIDGVENTLKLLWKFTVD